MSQQQPGPAQPSRSRRGCEWCIYGAVRWLAQYSVVDGLWEYEAELCDRCMEALHQRSADGFAHVWAVEEA